MSKGRRNRAEREARKYAHDHTQYEEGRWLGEVSDNPVAEEMIRRYNETQEERRQCPHLSENWDQARFWVEAVPELLACAKCTPVLAAKEKERRNTLCLMCRRHVALRGMSIATEGILMRSGLCKECSAEHGLLGETDG